MSNKTLETQYVQFHICLGELTPDADEQTCEAQYPVHSAAFRAFEDRYEHLLGYRESILEGRDAIEVQAFDLCPDEALIERVDDRLTWSVGISHHKAIPLPLLLQVRDLAVACYREAAAPAGLSVWFIKARRFEVYRVTEDSDVEGL